MTEFEQILPKPLLEMNRSFPVMEHLLNHLKQKQIIANLKIGWHCHLTWITALSAYCLNKAGAKLFISECNPHTTEKSAVEFMKSVGVDIYSGADSCKKVLAHKPSVLSDTGLVLISQYLEKPDFNLSGASEITTSGITRLREMKDLPITIININNSQLKTRIENFHGVGDGIIDALSILTNKSWSKRKATIVGYGIVGMGIAAYLKQIGASVSIVEKDPTRLLIAHYDGFHLTTLNEALANSDLLITATGSPNLIDKKEWEIAKDNLLVLNAGHWSLEINRDALIEISTSRKSINNHLEAFTIANSKQKTDRTIYLATEGNPVNVALCSGSPQPTLIHLTTELLCMEFLANTGINLPKGEIPVPSEVERTASKLSLAGLGYNLMNNQIVR